MAVRVGYSLTGSSVLRRTRCHLTPYIWAHAHRTVRLHQEQPLPGEERRVTLS